MIHVPFRMGISRVLLLDFVLACTIIGVLAVMVARERPVAQQKSIAIGFLTMSGYWEVAAVEEYAVTGEVRIKPGDVSASRNDGWFELKTLADGVGAFPRMVGSPVSQASYSVHFHADASGPAYTIGWTCDSDSADPSVVPALCRRGTAP
jgi:hypothetical protein